MRDHLYAEAMRLDMTLAIEIPEDAGALGLRATVRALATYARDGLPVWDWTDHGMAADGLLDVIAALYSRAAAADLDRTAIDVVDDVDPEDELGLVLVAAAARVRLDRQEPVSARELGALAGVGAHAIRHLTRSGEFPTTEGRPVRIPPEEAVRSAETNVRSRASRRAEVRAYVAPA